MFDKNQIKNAIIQAIQRAQFAPIENKGMPEGFASLDTTGKIPDTQLPENLEATKLKTSVTISLSGDIIGSANFDGSSNITIDTSVVNNSHTHSVENIEGLVEALANMSANTNIGTSVAETTFNNVMVQNQEILIPLSANISTPVVSVTKQVPQINVISDRWSMGSQAFEALEPSKLENINGSWMLSEYAIDDATINKTSNVSTSSIYAYAFAFKSDGSKLYMTTGYNVISQYTLTTPWDVSTMVDDAKSFTSGIYASGFSLRGLFFKSDGLKMFWLGGNNMVYETSLTTAWDISTANTAPTQVSISSATSSATVFYLKPDGTSFYVADANNVYQFNTTSGNQWNLTTATLVNTYPLPSQLVTTKYGMTFSSDGMKMYFSSTYYVHEYRMTSAWNLGNMYFFRSFDSPQETSYVYALNMSKDNNTLFIRGTSYIGEYTIPYGNYRLSSGYTSLLTKNTHSLVTKYWSNIDSIVGLSTTGTIYTGFYESLNEIYVAPSPNSKRSIVKYNPDINGFQVNIEPNMFGELWDGNYASLQSALNVALDFYLFNYLEPYGSAFHSNVSISAYDSNPRSVYIHPNGSYAYIIGTTGDRVLQVPMSTPYDITTLGSTQYICSVSAQDTSPVFLTFNTTGTKMYVVGTQGDDINQYTLNVAWRVDTAVFEKVVRPSQANYPLSITFNPDGTKAMILDDGDGDIYEYNLTTAWDIGTLSYTNRYYNGNSTKYSAQFVDNGNYIMYVDDEDREVKSIRLRSPYSLASRENPKTIMEIPSGFTGLFVSDATKEMYLVRNTSDVLYRTNEVPLYRNRQTMSNFGINKPIISNTLNVALFFKPETYGSSASISGVNIQYDANVQNKNAIEGVDYEWDIPSNNEIKFKALTAGTFKGRII